MSKNDVLDFSDLASQEVRVPIGNKVYVLREPTGDAVVKWRNAQLRSSKMVDGKLSSIDGMADAEPLLVSLCLFECRPQPDGTEVQYIVKENTVRAWPNRVQRALYDKVMELGHLNESGEETKETLREQIKDLQEKLHKLEVNGVTEQEELAKNLLCATTDGSS